MTLILAGALKCVSLLIEMIALRSATERKKWQPAVPRDVRRKNALREQRAAKKNRRLWAKYHRQLQYESPWGFWLLHAPLGRVARGALDSAFLFLFIGVYGRVRI